MHIIQAEIGAPKVSVKKIADNHALFSVSPLPNGYGMTLGNTFRRVLLSSLPGAAVTSVKIKGVNHEYTTLSGVQDSVLDMLLNLKGLRVKKHSSEPTVLTLKVKDRTGEIKAKDIESNAEVEILNPELVISTLDKKGSLEMEITVEKGVGYLPAAIRQEENKEAGRIMLDATFTPVERVRYDVSATRVGSLTNLDKLELEVVTTGSMTPEDSVKFASNLVNSYFTIFNEEQVEVEPDFQAKVTVGAAVQTAETAAVSDGEVAVGTSMQEKYTPIETLQFSPRTLNALINGGIGSIEQLVKCTPNKIANLRGFGNKALDEVVEKLAEKDLKLREED